MDYCTLFCSVFESLMLWYLSLAKLGPAAALQKAHYSEDLQIILSSWSETCFSLLFI